MGGRKKGADRNRRTAQQKREWIGGCVLAPAYVIEPEPHRPLMYLWLELPEGVILKGTMLDPTDPSVSFADSLLAAMNAPMVGPPRRPERIRIADERLAEEIRKVAPGIPVVVAPTPELDELVQHLMEALPAEQAEEEPSSREDGRISPQAVEKLFRAAKILFHAAPWKVASDQQVLRLDIPELAVNGACLSIIGALGETTGIILFPSLEGFEAFLAAAERHGAAGGDPMNLGTSVLSLTFERGADLPGSMRREISRFGWPVAGPNAYPMVEHRDPDGLLRPLTERDVGILSACATTLGAFFARHPELFSSDDWEPVCESYFDPGGIEVRLTAPYWAGPYFDVDAPPGQPSGRVPRSGTASGRPVGRKVGRNSPCPCGSGKKYKKCCMRKDDEAARAAVQPGVRAAVHDLDNALVERMVHFAEQRFGEAFYRSGKDFMDPAASFQLSLPWSVYHYPVEGKPVVRWFLEEGARGLSGRERAWLEAQQGSWLSVWEVAGAEPDRGLLSLTDLLTGQGRTVTDLSASKHLDRRSAILARVVDFEGISVLCGAYPRPLPPLLAAKVVRTVRKRLRRKSAVPAERLRNEKVGRFMIRCWEEAVEEMEEGLGRLPELRNTDGDPLLMTVDHFGFEPAERRNVEARLAAMEGVEPPSPDRPEEGYTFIRPGNKVALGLPNTVLGRVVVSDGKLRAETNSIRRADRLRARIEEACGSLVRHRTREHADPRALLDEGQERAGSEDTDSGLPSEVVESLTRELKQRHYTEWPDHPLPALNGKTPREAARTREGREQVDLLIKDLEHHESREPPGRRFDFSLLRKELGLDA